MLFAYAKTSTYQCLYSTSRLLDFEQEKIREVGHLANPPTRQCAIKCQFSWRLLKSLWSVGVRPSRFSAELLGPVPLHRQMRKPRRGARYVDASRPWALAKFTSCWLGMSILNVSAGGLGPSTGKHHGWFFHDQKHVKKSGKILLMSQTVRSSKTKDRYCKMWENTSQLLSGCSNKAFHVLAVHCNHRDTIPYIVMQEINWLFACSLLFMLSEWDFRWFSSSLKVTRDWSACSEPQKNRL